MIEQYCPPRMAELFSDKARFTRWLAVELAVTEAWETLGRAAPGTADAVRDAVAPIDEAFLDEVAARRRVTGHELAAFVDVLCRRAGPTSRWVHVGMTSADVIDTANAMLLGAAADVLAGALGDLGRTLEALAAEFATTPVVGRTHGMFAEPTTFGTKLVLWALRVRRDLDRVRRAREVVAVGSLSGPVGVYSNIDPEVEVLVCEKLGLERSANAQFVSRDRHAEYVWACASIGCTVEAVTTELRLLHTSEIGEVAEAFEGGQKGSSSMPHKKNPAVSMELSGLSRVLRSYLLASMESTATWHEGDTTALAVERIVLPDASNLALYLLERLGALLAGLRVDAGAMRANLERAGGLIYSSSVLHALIDAGVDRETAYRAVQAASSASGRGEGSLRDSLGEALGGGSGGASRGSGPVPLGEEALDEAFDLTRNLRHAAEVHRMLGPPTAGPTPRTRRR